MVSQIFKDTFPKDGLFKFLEQCSEKKTNYYYLTKTSYKSAQYKEYIEPFCEEIKNYYFKSKQHYATRKMNYKNLITIIRQLCKYHHIPFTSAIKYDKSSYEISYSIYFDSEQLTTI